jgi:hypothetical protein
VFARLRTEGFAVPVFFCPVPGVERSVRSSWWS